MAGKLPTALPIITPEQLADDDLILVFDVSAQTLKRLAAADTLFMNTPAAAIAEHVAATDPHGDRTAAATALSGHVSATDPHGDRAHADSVAAGKAPLASPTFTGTPAAPTAAAGTNTTQIATTAFVKAAIEALINGAPGTLDTLNEIAAALAADESAIAALTAAIAGKQPANANLTAYDIPMLYVGTPGNSALIASVLLPRPVTFPAGLSGSLGKVGTNPTASYTLTVAFIRSGSTVASGSISISTSGVVTFTLASAFTSQAGDELKITGAATADATLAGLKLTLVGAV